jgi:capsular exopolysaccharide synthesis family protein
MLRAAMPPTAGDAPQPTGDDAFAAEIIVDEPAAAAGSGAEQVRFEAAAAAEPAPPTPSMFERIDSRLAEKVVADTHMMPVSREQYRRLAAVLHDAQGTSSLQVVLVASAVAGEGKTLTSCNLALTLSESYRRRVLLIDADLRRPALHHVFKLDASVGLSDGLAANADSSLVVRQVSPNLAILPAGRPSADPMAGLISQRMRRLIDEAKQTFDWVILDTPPLVLLPDANLLASMADGVVLVIRADATPHRLVRRALDTLGRSRIVGAVLNQATGTPAPAYYSYYNYYTPPLAAGETER